MLAHLASAQVNDAVGRVEQPRVGIPLLDGGNQPRVFSCQAHPCRACLGAGDALALTCRTLGGELAAYLAREREHLPFFVSTPASAVPYEPLVPLRHMP